MLMTIYMYIFLHIHRVFGQRDVFLVLRKIMLKYVVAHFEKNMKALELGQ